MASWMRRVPSGGPGQARTPGRAASMKCEVCEDRRETRLVRDAGSPTSTAASPRQGGDSPAEPATASTIRGEAPLATVGTVRGKIRYEGNIVQLGETKAWMNLRALASELESSRIEDLLATDPARVSRYSVPTDLLDVDYSKQLVDDSVMDNLEALFLQQDVRGKINSMASGDIINLTEDQPALHMALRGSLDPEVQVNSERVIDQVQADRSQLSDFATSILRDGRFTHVVHIGIGGSSFGPQLLLDALQEYGTTSIEVRFLHNIDPYHYRRTLEDLPLDRTLFIVASKSFRTEETLAHAVAVCELLISKGLRPTDQVVALSNNTDLAAQVGIATVFPIREWIPGRFSLWGPLALTTFLGLGRKVFDRVCDGARQMDEHFLRQDFRSNIPMVLAALSVWNVNFLNSNTHSILPYAERLRKMVPYLQQLEMESNGKSVDRHGAPIGIPTAPVVWGGVGTTGQHTFYQMLHQGTQRVPSDIILDLGDAPGDPEYFARRLVANGIAQAKALMEGTGPIVDGPDYLKPHRFIRGDQPSTVLALPGISPESVGALLACYEHKVATQGFVWNINSFDQYGVELGKVVARRVFVELGKTS